MTISEEILERKINDNVLRLLRSTLDQINSDFTVLFIQLPDLFKWIRVST
jgi:hypothetical protein